MEGLQNVEARGADGAKKGKYYELFLVQSKYYGEGGAADVD